MKNKALSLLKCQIRLDESIESNTVSKLMMSVWGLVLWIFTSSSEVRTSEYLRAVFSLVKEWNSRNNVYRYTYRCIQYMCVSNVRLFDGTHEKSGKVWLLASLPYPCITGSKVWHDALTRSAFSMAMHILSHITLTVLQFVCNIFWKKYLLG